MHILRRLLRVNILGNRNHIRGKKLNALNEILMSMPKEKSARSETLQQRHKMKDKNMKYNPGSVTLQVLGSGAKGAPRSLYVFTDQSRYLFNCGEGTQRLAHEHKMKLSKLEHIFITHPCWENIGGLPGVALTIQDVGVPEITLHGPRGTADIFNATRRFVVLKDLNVNFKSEAAGQFIDSVMKVDYVPIAPLKEGISTPNQSTEYCRDVVIDEDDDNEDYYDYENKEDSVNKIHRKRKNSSENIENKRFKSNYGTSRLGENGSISMCYICQLHPKQGTLLLDRCVDLGVPPGPLLGQLKAGQDVVLANGTIVKASDVCSPPDPGPVFLVIDCPSIDYINSLLSSEKLCKYSHSSASEDKDNLMAVIHFSPPEVLSNAKYLDWVSTFSPNVTQMSLAEGNTCSGSIAVHRLQHKLNLLHPQIFPILADSGIPRTLKNREDIKNEQDSQVVVPVMDASSEMEAQGIHASGMPKFLHKTYIKGSTFHNIHLRPRKGFDSAASLKMDIQEFIDETMAVDGFIESFEELKKRLRGFPAHENSFPRILFLGTGSCIPNKTRNTSGILIEISENTCMLLDCGEGTYSQLVRFFGVTKTNEILEHLRCIFVSHLHADHHIGLISLLKERQKLFKGKTTNILYLLAPRQIMFWLNFYDNCFEQVLHDIKLVPCAEVVSPLVDPMSVPHPVVAVDMKTSLGLKEIATAPVCHCQNAFGVAIAHEEWKITYSGDTMPCEELVKLGIESDLLIHEATMEDELVGEARAKRHSTTSEAIKVGHEMKAKFIILTHFSQRYAKLPRIKGSMKENVGIAFDNMQVTLPDLQVLPVLYPALRLMFSDHCEEMEQKAIRRQLKLEKEKRKIT
ncbi:ribonuclease Z, mitochondrial [Hetaerina americana]|uniref:ribonuclease Z, mitochondrial n=1 Tax=Hetaerina americana TaxID=62018 RepID=UPI003A7F1EED